MVTNKTIKRERIAEKQRAASKYKRQLRKNATKWEKMALSKLIMDYPTTVFQKSFLTGGCIYIVDFYIPFPHGVVIEVDGGHHYKGHQLIKDKRRDRHLRSMGLIVLRVKNNVVGNICFKTLIETAKKRRYEKE